MQKDMQVGDEEWPQHYTWNGTSFTIQTLNYVKKIVSFYRHNYLEARPSLKNKRLNAAINNVKWQQQARPEKKGLP